MGPAAPPHAPVCCVPPRSERGCAGPQNLDAPLRAGARPPRRLVCTGALTNAALMLSLYPELHSRLEIVIMGGAIGIGNTSPAAGAGGQQDVRGRERAGAA